jgi:hypothetical protein
VGREGYLLWCPPLQSLRFHPSSHLLDVGEVMDCQNRQHHDLYGRDLHSLSPTSTSPEIDYTILTSLKQYIGTIVEVINEGLPRAAYKVIGDKSRLSFSRRLGISNAMIIFQLFLGLLMSIVICSSAKSFTDSFVPREVRDKSVLYVRISAFSTLFSAIDVAVSVCTRSLDRPDVPLVISTVKTMVNIILDLLFLSTFRVTASADVNTQAIIRLCCDAAGALAGAGFYLYIAGLVPLKRVENERGANDSRRPDIKGLMRILRPGSYMFTESAVRNALYLWLVSGIVSLGNDYATVSFLLPKDGRR